MKKILPYIYASTVSITANSQSNLTFIVNANYDFYLTAFSYYSTCSDNNQKPIFSFKIKSNDDNIISDWISSLLFSGYMTETANTPHDHYQIGMTNWFKFDKPYIFPASSNIVVEIRNDIAFANTIMFALKGIRKYR